MEHRLALLTLNMLPGVGPWRKRMLVEFFGSVESALSAPEEALAKVHGIGPRLARQLHGESQTEHLRRIRKRFARVERERERRKYGREARKRILFDAEPSGRLTPAFIRIHSGNGAKDTLEHHAPRSGTQRFAVAENIGPQLRKRDQRHICVIRNAASRPLEHSDRKSVV